MSTTVHAYICECEGRSYRACSERVFLTPARYRELSRYGAVVSPYCTTGRRVVHREPGVRVVASSRLAQA